MGVPVLVLGFSGSGKSSSLRNFKPDEVGVFAVAGKRLPFRSKLSVINMERKKGEYAEKGEPFNGYRYIMHALKASTRRSFVIDDSQYLMSFEEMDSTKTGYDKFNSIGFNFIGLVRYIRSSLPDDVIVYLIMHEETNDYGDTKLKTIGKLLDQKVCVEGLVTICLRAMKEGTKKYFFRTQSDGQDISKSPEDMFPLEIDNDLKAVTDRIREFWGL